MDMHNVLVSHFIVSRPLIGSKLCNDCAHWLLTVSVRVIIVTLSRYFCGSIICLTCIKSSHWPRSFIICVHIDYSLYAELTFTCVG